MLILKEAPKSTDTDLQSLICELKACLPPIEIIKCADDIVNRAMYSTAIYVGEGLLKQESFLLPSVHELFHAFAAEVAHMANLDFGESENLITASWLLSNLVVCLQHHLAYAYF